MGILAFSTLLVYKDLFFNGLCVGGHTEAKETSDPLELELQAVVNQLMGMLRSKSRSSGRTVCAINH